MIVFEVAQLGLNALGEYLYVVCAFVEGTKGSHAHIFKVFLLLFKGLNHDRLVAAHRIVRIKRHQQDLFYPFGVEFGQRLFDAHAAVTHAQCNGNVAVLLNLVLKAF